MKQSLNQLTYNILEKSEQVWNRVEEIIIDPPLFKYYLN